MHYHHMPPFISYIRTVLTKHRGHTQEVWRQRESIPKRKQTCPKYAPSDTNTKKYRKVCSIEGTEHLLTRTYPSFFMSRRAWRGM